MHSIDLTADYLMHSLLCEVRFVYVPGQYIGPLDNLRVKWSAGVVKGDGDGGSNYDYTPIPLADIHTHPPSEHAVGRLVLRRTLRLPYRRDLYEMMLGMATAMESRT